MGIAKFGSDDLIPEITNDESRKRYQSELQEQSLYLSSTGELHHRGCYSKQSGLRFSTGSYVHFELSVTPDVESPDSCRILLNGSASGSPMEPLFEANIKKADLPIRPVVFMQKHASVELVDFQFEHDRV